MSATSSPKSARVLTPDPKRKIESLSHKMYSPPRMGWAQIPSPFSCTKTLILDQLATSAIYTRNHRLPKVLWLDQSKLIMGLPTRRASTRRASRRLCFRLVRRIGALLLLLLLLLLLVRFLLGGWLLNLRPRLGYPVHPRHLRREMNLSPASGRQTEAEGGGRGARGLPGSEDLGFSHKPQMTRRPALQR